MKLLILLFAVVCAAVAAETEKEKRAVYSGSFGYGAPAAYGAYSGYPTAAYSGYSGYPSAAYSAYSGYPSAAYSGYPAAAYSGYPSGAYSGYPGYSAYSGAAGWGQGALRGAYLG